MNTMNVRDASRPKLSLRYGATNAQTVSRERDIPAPIATTQRLVGRRRHLGRPWSAGRARWPSRRSRSSCS